MPRAGPPALSVESRDAEALFDDRNPPAFPHRGRMVDPRLASYLEGLAREQRSARALEVVVTLHSAALAPGEEERVRRQLRTYFAEEEAIADLDVRVNRVEGRGSIRFGGPLLLVALAVAGVFYFLLPQLRSTSLVSFVTALLYLVFITVVWVLLWDPTEKLLFDAYFLRARRAALGKLAAASVRFAYAPEPPG
jgi:hypothetical protein